MGALFPQIRDAVESDRFIVGIHASNQLETRGIDEWQAVCGIRDATLLSERPHTQPNPTIEVEQLLPDGTPMKAVWAWIAWLKMAKLVTVHYFDQ